MTLHLDFFGLIDFCFLAQALYQESLLLKSKSSIWLLDSYYYMNLPLNLVWIYYEFSIYSTWYDASLYLSSYSRPRHCTLINSISSSSSGVLKHRYGFKTPYERSCFCHRVEQSLQRVWLVHFHRWESPSRHNLHLKTFPVGGIIAYKQPNQMYTKFMSKCILNSWVNSY